MHIRVLGRLQVTDELGTRLPADGLPRRARQLLGVLTARHDRIQTKDSLAEAVWGDDLPGNHVAALEHYVHVLRRRLQPGGTASASFILTRDRGYVFDTTRASLDLAELRLRVRSLDGHSPTDPQRLRLHQEILDLAIDLPFPEDEFAEWAQAARNEVRAAVLAARLQLSELALGDDPARALRLAQEAIELDPYVEHAYRAAMSAAAALGRPDDALRWYEKCRMVLAKELGVEPSGETTLLRSTIAGHRLSSHESAGIAPGTPPRPPAPPGSPKLLGSPELLNPPPTPARPLGSAGLSRSPATVTATDQVFVGRRTELALLLDESPASVVHLVGPPGSGKSALLAEMRRQAPERVGIGHGPGSAEALRLMWLRSALTDIGARGEELAVVDAAMTERRALLPMELESLGTALDRSAPTLLAIDDAGSLDKTSVSELAWLSRRCPRLSLVLAYRYPSTVANKPIAGLGAPVVLRLAPLGADDVAELGDPTLMERTGGIAALVGAAHRPPEVVEAVAMQVARLRTQWMPPDSWEVLRLCAVLGPLRVDDLAALTSRPVGVLLTCVDQLIHAHLLTEDLGGYVRHRSNLVRAAVAEQVSGVSGLHLRELLASAAR